MTYIAVAVVAFGAGFSLAIALSLAKALTPPQPPRRDPESYWHGYRRGWDDGAIATVHIERTPSPN